tara:strand:- start:2862 stop:3287 length:426 start_codon:yes stop_codon:yes gene_type:complete
MTDILFYVLAATTIVEQQQFVCRLTEKALSQGKRVYIHTGSRNHAEQLDRQLWEFRDSAFVPHSLVDEQRPVGQSPVHIGWHEAPPEQHDVLINLHHQLPSFLAVLIDWSKSSSSTMRYWNTLATIFVFCVTGATLLLTRI